eukprot:m.112140 g.112140  ORF g.112140 m.112140 type:complete len:96 (-) comp9248_c1_seq1:5831-6118(-)
MIESQVLLLSLFGGNLSNFSLYCQTNPSTLANFSLTSLSHVEERISLITLAQTIFIDNSCREAQDMFLLPLLLLPPPSPPRLRPRPHHLRKRKTR